MGVFDSLKNAAGKLIGGDGQEALAGAIEQSPLGGVSGLLDKLREGGLGGAVSSWTSEGAKLPVSPEQIGAALDKTHVDDLAASLGIPTDQVLGFLSKHLPGLAASQQQVAKE